MNKCVDLLILLDGTVKSVLERAVEIQGLTKTDLQVLIDFLVSVAEALKTCT